MGAYVMVERYGVSYAEATRRIELQGAVHELDDQLYALLGDASGGMWFDHGDGGRLKIAVARAGEHPDTVRRLKQLLARNGFTDDAAIVPVDFTYRELEAAQARLSGELGDLYDAYKIRSSLDVTLNAVKISMATNVTRADIARLRRVAERAPVRVVLEQTDEPDTGIIEL